LVIDDGPAVARGWLSQASTIFQRVNREWAAILGTAEIPSRRREDRLGTARPSGAATRGFRQRTALPDEDGTDGLLLKAIVRAKEGDRDALTFLYVRYADNIYGYVRSIVRDEHEAEDITQQLFSKLTFALSRYEPRSVPFSAWILRVARNLAIDHIPRERPRHRNDQHDQLSPGEHTPTTSPDENPLLRPTNRWIQAKAAQPPRARSLRR
jgi:DNA-directed RNA polymerase specialized sigma24 family protein